MNPKIETLYGSLGAGMSINQYVYDAPLYNQFATDFGDTSNMYDYLYALHRNKLALVELQKLCALPDSPSISKLPCNTQLVSLIDVYASAYRDICFSFAVYIAVFAIRTGNQTTFARYLIPKQDVDGAAIIEKYISDATGGQF